MPKFSFNEYRLDTRTWVEDGIDCRSHTLELSGHDVESGNLNQAILIFNSGSDLCEARACGTVGYMTNNGQGGMSLVGWLPLEEFGVYQEVLACGGGLSVDFELSDPSAGVGYVRRLGLGHYEKVVCATICRRPARLAGPAEIVPLHV